MAYGVFNGGVGMHGQNHTRDRHPRKHLNGQLSFYLSEPGREAARVSSADADAAPTISPAAFRAASFLGPMPLTRSDKSPSDAYGPPLWRSSRRFCAVLGPIPLMVRSSGSEA